MCDAVPSWPDDIAIRIDGSMAGGAMEVTSMGNDELEIVRCRIPALSQLLATRRALRLADYPLARASEWSPLPAGVIPFGASAEESEDLIE